MGAIPTGSIQSKGCSGREQRSDKVGEGGGVRHLGWAAIIWHGETCWSAKEKPEFGWGLLYLGCPVDTTRLRTRGKGLGWRCTSESSSTCMPIRALGLWTEMRPTCRAPNEPTWRDGWREVSQKRRGPSTGRRRRKPGEHRVLGAWRAGISARRKSCREACREAKRGPAVTRGSGKQREVVGAEQTGSGGHMRGASEGAGTGCRQPRWEDSSGKKSTDCSWEPR